MHTTVNDPVFVSILQNFSLLAVDLFELIFLSSK